MEDQEGSLNIRGWQWVQTLSLSRPSSKCFPVQAKGGRDQHGVVQTSQDIAWCVQRLPELLCRPISVQFVTETKIAMFELFDDHGVIKVAEERHYELVPSEGITVDDLKTYCRLAKD